MEVKVLVDGLPRVVCGVTEETTCQDAVIALAQALGRPGRYTLQEKFKDFERCMAPGECLLETLEKYGEQARDVRLTLLHNGPSVEEFPTTAPRVLNYGIHRSLHATLLPRGKPKALRSHLYILPKKKKRKNCLRSQFH
uniref:Ras association domain family member 11 n=1 Tax=Cyclopterus lumpus TaxID=8103 RepID=A0A8C3G538_CYCLU